MDSLDPKPRRRALPACFCNQPWKRVSITDGTTNHWTLTIGANRNALHLSYDYTEDEGWALWHGNADTFRRGRPAQLLAHATTYILTDEWPEDVDPENGIYDI